MRAETLRQAARSLAVLVASVTLFGCERWFYDLDFGAARPLLTDAAEPRDATAVDGRLDDAGTADGVVDSGDVATATDGDSLDGNDATDGDTGGADAARITVQARRIAAGYTHTCAISRTGETVCWGSARDGKVGSGPTSATLGPKVVSGLPVPVMAVVVGVSHTCVVDSAGTSSCFGSNLEGQLGLGPTVSSTVTPGRVPIREPIVELSAHQHHTCARGASNALYCFGAGDHGQLGDGRGTTTSSPARVPVDGLSIVAGGAHSCAIEVGATAVCWGDNLDGQLGTGTDQPTWLPDARPVLGSTAALRSLCAGWDYTCALFADGVLSCWGSNADGQLGQPRTLAQSALPLSVPAGELAFRDVACGVNHTCAVTESDGSLYCWGQSSSGQLGPGGAADWSPSPVLVPLPAPVVHASAGRTHTCAMLQDETAYCWGNNSQGQLGVSGISFTSTPTRVPIP